LTSPNPITAIPGTPRSCDNPVVCVPLARSLRTSRFFTPFTFSLIGLAVAVALWGYGYKLSLYHRHPGNASVNQVAKLWIKERGSVASSLRAVASTDRNQESTAQPAPQRPGALNVLLAAITGFERPSSQSPVEFDLLSRPPPSTSSL
jgi:hypothetical protein